MGDPAGWTVKIKTNFSKDSPIWLLGRCYHRKQDGTSSVSPFEETVIDIDSGIEGFKADFISRIWFTYRREFSTLNGSNYTTDCGWGCMLRSGQMLLAQALVYHMLGREWRWYEVKNPSINPILFREDSLHRKIIRWFADYPSQISPLSIHSLVELGESTGKKAGDWYGPASVAHLLRQAIEKAGEENHDFRDLVVYVSQDCTVYIQDIIDQCEIKSDEAISQDVRTYVEEKEGRLGTAWVDVSLIKQTTNPSSSSVRQPTWKSLILLVPVRLGAEKLNSIYRPCLTGLLALDHCIEDKLIHLDPHFCQERVDVWKPNFPLDSFHCHSPRKMSLLRMDPSCCIGFYCKTREEFDIFVKSVQPMLIPPHQKSEYPIFVFCDGRSRDALSYHKFEIPDDPLRGREADADDGLLFEEFEVI